MVHNYSKFNMYLFSPFYVLSQDVVFALQESLFPPVLWEFYNKIPLFFKVRFPGDSQSLCWIPRLGWLMWGLESLQQCENLFGIIVHQFVGCHRKAMTNQDSVLKSRDITLLTKVYIVKAMVIPVVIYRYESWTIKKAEWQRIDAFELWCWRKHLRVPWTAKKSNQAILKEINTEYSLEGLMLKLNL